jgi:RNA polymerase sigma-70 factor (ECF subfamily)
MRNLKKLSDNELVGLVLNQNASANTELFCRYKSFIKGFLYNKGISQIDSEDLSMVIFAKIFSKINTFDIEKGSLKSWISRIINNTIIDYYRSNRNKYQTVYISLINNVSEYTFDFASTLSSDSKIISKENLDLLYTAIQQLPAKYRNIIELLIDEKNNNEISKITGIKANAIGVQKLRALKQLKEILLTFKM